MTCFAEEKDISSPLKRGSNGKLTNSKHKKGKKKSMIHLFSLKEQLPKSNMWCEYTST